MRSAGVWPTGVILPSWSVISSINLLKSSSRLPTCQYTVGVPTPSSDASLRMLNVSTPSFSIILIVVANTLSTVTGVPAATVPVGATFAFCATTPHLGSYTLIPSVYPHLYSDP